MPNQQTTGAELRKIAIEHILAFAKKSTGQTLEVHDSKGMHCVHIQPDGSLQVSGYAGEPMAVTQTVHDLPWSVIGLALEACAAAGNPL